MPAYLFIFRCIFHAPFLLFVIILPKLEQLLVSLLQIFIELWILLSQSLELSLVRCNLSLVLLVLSPHRISLNVSIII